MTDKKYWHTSDELEMLSYMASNKQHSLDDNIKKIQTWIDTAYTRKWGYTIDVDECMEHAKRLHKELIEEKANLQEYIFLHILHCS